MSSSYNGLTVDNVASIVTPIRRELMSWAVPPPANGNGRALERRTGIALATGDPAEKNLFLPEKSE